MAESYLEIEPRAELRGYVAAIWFATVDPADGGPAVLPDGCMDIIWAGALEPFVAGPDTQARPAGIAPGTALVGVRFLPGIAAALLGVPVSEVTNQTVSLDRFWRPAEVRELRERVAEGRSPREMAQRMEDRIAVRIRSGTAPDRAVQSAIDVILRSALDGRKQSGTHRELSERQLRRRFRDAVGYGPKTFERVARFRRFMWLAQNRANVGLAALAAHAGYADQSHLTRECVRIAGCTPRRLLPAAPVSDLFKTIASSPAINGA
jgi:AraC-like DNA-binding protein